MELAESLRYSKSSKAGRLCPVPLKEPSESPSPVANGSFFASRELGHGLSFTRDYKNRVVTEAAVAARRGSDFAVHFAIKCNQGFAIDRNGDHGKETGTAIALPLEQGEKFLIVGFVRRISSGRRGGCKTGGMDSGCTSKGSDFQSRIVCQ